jgi:large subunit ribosomal protein L29
VAGFDCNFEIVKLIKMSKRIDFVKSIKEMSEADLRARVQEDEMRLKKLEFAHAITPLENPMSIRALRKDLARLKTALKQKPRTTENQLSPAESVSVA